jgi:hypothetical protein
MKVSKVSSQQMFNELGVDHSKVTVPADFFRIQTNSGPVLFFKTFELGNSSVFVVTRNADFTEGRGPMIFHKVFSDFDVAVAYVLTKEGIYGSAQRAAVYAGINIKGEPYVMSTFNGYEISISALC